MVKLSKKLYWYKPILLGISLNTNLQRINDDELGNYSHIIRDRDDRKCQILINYDRLYEVIEEAINEFELNRPGLFLNKYIDRRSLTHILDDQVNYFNSRGNDLSSSVLAPAAA